MIFKVLKFQSKTIAGGAFVIGVLSLVSRFVGLIRDRILAGTFGAGDVLDVYYAAFRIPDAVFALLVVGALSASFIPIFSRYFGKSGLDKPGAWQFTNNMLHLLGATFAVLSLIGIALAVPAAQLVAPGFDAAKQMDVAALMRIMFLAQFFLAISTVFGSVLQAVRRFFVYALAPIVYNVGIILGAVVLVPSMGIIGLAWGVVIGGFLHMLLSTLGVLLIGYRYRPAFQPKHPDAKEALRLMVPRVLGLGVVQLQFIVLSMMASGLVAGSLAAFQLAYNLQYFPVGILGVSYAIAVFPAFSEQIAKGEREAFAKSFQSTIRQMLFFLIPATLIFLLLRAQIVRVVLGAGVFGWEETLLVADTLAFFSLSFFAQSITHVLVRGFFAFKDSTTPLIAGVVSVIALIAAGSYFSAQDAFGVMGLAIGFSIASVIQMAILWALLRHKAGSLKEGCILKGLIKMTAAGLVCAVVIQFAKPLTLTILSLETFWGVFLQGAFAATLGFAAYLVVAWLLKIRELKTVWEGLDRRVLSKIRPKEPLVETVE